MIYLVFVKRAKAMINILKTWGSKSYFRNWNYRRIFRFISGIQFWSLGADNPTTVLDVPQIPGCDLLDLRWNRHLRYVSLLASALCPRRANELTLVEIGRCLYLRQRIAAPGRISLLCLKRNLHGLSVPPGIGYTRTFCR